MAPLFSAKSVDGVRAYEMARRRLREGLPLEDTDIIQANRITIYSLKLEQWLDSAPEQTVLDDGKGRIRVADISGRRLPTAMLRVDCSKGTYIRALARDLGEALGSGAFLSSLRRTGNGGFTIEEALTLEEVMELFNQDGRN